MSTDTVTPLPPGTRVLIVDDEMNIRDMERDFLIHRGIQVVEAGDGREAIALYRATGSTIAAVVLDMVMPKMSGIDCLKGLRAINPTVKVIIASGFTDDKAVSEALSHGAAAFIHKPFDMKTFVGEIERVISEPSSL